MVPITPFHDPLRLTPIVLTVAGNILYLNNMTNMFQLFHVRKTWIATESF
jgi:Ca2+/Na+ antiporter